MPAPMNLVLKILHPKENTVLSYLGFSHSFHMQQFMDITILQTTFRASKFPTLERLLVSKIWIPVFYKKKNEKRNRIRIWKNIPDKVLGGSKVPSPTGAGSAEQFLSRRSLYKYHFHCWYTCKSFILHKLVNKTLLGSLYIINLRFFRYISFILILII